MFMLGLVMYSLSCLKWLIQRKQPALTNQNKYPVITANQEHGDFAIARFPAFVTNYNASRLSAYKLLSRACQRLPSLPALAPVGCFPALGAGYLCSRVWHWLHSFPALGSYKYLLNVYKIQFKQLEIYLL